MELLAQDLLPIVAQKDIVLARQLVRTWAARAGFSLVDQTKVITAASELARNTLEYGGGGHMEIALLENEKKRPGLRLVFKDEGPGINDVALALTDGYTSGRGLGMGLSGSKRLMNEFNLDTTPGKGTCVTVIKWR
jgi:serine/threonine-protein kinase RsbT